MAIDLPDAILAVGALGTAAFGLVDATKALWGGVSNAGFSHITRVLTHLFPDDANRADKGNPIALGAMRDTLRANWLNGTTLADQMSIAKTLIKLRLDKDNARVLAAKTGVDPKLLTSLATKYANGSQLVPKSQLPPEDQLTPEEQNVAGRFDTLLTTLLDEAYQRADQAYRNSAKAWSMVAAVALAALGKLAVGDTVGWGTALMAGLLATPLAPTAKDLASALQASVKALQVFRT